MVLESFGGVTMERLAKRIVYTRNPKTKKRKKLKMNSSQAFDGKLSLHDFLQRVEMSHQRRTGLLVRKNQDYSEEVDPFSNFRCSQQICALLDIDVRRSPKDVALFFVVHKLVRLGNLSQKDVKNPVNESLLDTFDDAHNYLDLAEGLEFERLVKNASFDSRRTECSI